MASWRRSNRGNEPPNACQQTQPGQRGHDHLAVLRADVLRGSVRDVLHHPVGRQGPGPALARCAPGHPARRRPTRPCCCCPASPARWACSRLSAARSGASASIFNADAVGPARVVRAVLPDGRRTSSAARGTSTLNLVKYDHLTISSSNVRLGVLPGHRVPRAARDRRPDRVPVPARPYLRRQDASPMNSRSARSSCRTTGTSSTSCGSACSPPSTSSTSQGTASELDHRQAQAARSPATRPCCSGSSLVASLYAALTGHPAAARQRRRRPRAPRGRQVIRCSRRTARAATGWTPRAPRRRPA